MLPWGATMFLGEKWFQLKLIPGEMIVLQVKEV